MNSRAFSLPPTKDFFDEPPQISLGLAITLLILHCNLGLPLSHCLLLPFSFKNVKSASGSDLPNLSYHPLNFHMLISPKISSTPNAILPSPDYRIWTDISSSHLLQFIMLSLCFCVCILSLSHCNLLGSLYHWRVLLSQCLNNHHVDSSLISPLGPIQDNSGFVIVSYIRKHSWESERTLKSYTRTTSSICRIS